MSDMERLVPRSLSPEQIKEIKEAFDLFDIDGTGRIDPQEVQLALNTLGYAGAREEVQAIVHELERTHKRSMDFPEFLRIVTRTLQSRDPAGELLKAFMRFDDDATGRISFRNLKRVALELGEQLTDDELRIMIQAADVDLDGEIGQEEFIELMSKAEVF
jgi:Ca2+-binding EF-hand superfamily protein